MGPKAPPYRVKQGVPKLLNDLLNTFLPNGLTPEQKLSEIEAISTFIKELNKVSHWTILSITLLLIKILKYFIICKYFVILIRTSTFSTSPGYIIPLIKKKIIYFVFI